MSFSSSAGLVLSSGGAPGGQTQPPQQQQQQPQQQQQQPQQNYQLPQQNYQQPQQNYQQPQQNYQQPQQNYQPQQSYQQPQQSYQQPQQYEQPQQPQQYKPAPHGSRYHHDPADAPLPMPGKVFTGKPARVRSRIPASGDADAETRERPQGPELTTTPAMREQTQFLPLFHKGASYTLQDPPAIDLNSLPSQVVNMYKRRFDAIDLNKDGIITLREIATVGKVFGYRLSREELGDIFGKRDIDDSGTITFDEFVKALWERANKSKNLGPVRQIFRQFDVHNRGYITSDEAHPILKNELGFDMNKTESLIDMFDKNKDYRLSIQEFVEFYKKVQQLKEEIVKAFNEWDIGNDGFVDFSEARNIMGPKGFSDDDVRAMIAKYDEDQDGRLSYPEFASFWDIPLFES